MRRPVPVPPSFGLILVAALAAGATVIALAAAAPARADDPPCGAGAAVLVDGLGTPVDELLHAAELAGAAVPTPRVIRRGGAREVALCGGATLPWALPMGAAGDESAPNAAEREAEAEGRPAELGLRLLPLRLTTVLATGYPGGRNDGLLWEGRGVNAMVSGGFAFRWRFLSGALAPEVAASANEPFETVPVGAGAHRFSNPFHGTQLDLPQRFGADPFAEASLGQSFLRADLAGVGLGVSTENLWFGPGQRNALVMSSAGPGFPHVFVGTSRPADVWIGDAEALVFWGRLSRSDDFPDRGRPLVSGVVLDLSPRFAPTLTLGVARVFIQTWDLSARTLLAGFQRPTKEGLEDRPEDNQLATLFARWVFPASGFEVYGEWGREDHELDFDDTVREPDHSQGYLVGLSKVWRAGARWVRLQAELTALQEQRPLANARGVPVWYTHGENLSWTHRGQLLGAWIGPGADAQTLAVDVYGARGRLGAFVERVRRNDAFYWSAIEPADPLGRSHDVELGGGLRGVVLTRGLELSWEAAGGKRWNRDFLGSEWNARLSLGLAFPGASGAGAGGAGSDAGPGAGLDL